MFSSFDVARALWRAAIALLVVVTAACGDTTAPDTGTTIVVSIDSMKGPGFTSIDGRTVAVCDLYLAAKGRGRGEATWHSANVLFYWGPNRSIPQDSIAFTAEDITSFWGAQRIGADSTQTSAWQFWFELAFDVEIVFKYVPTPTSQERESKVRFACGPATTPSTPYPTITNVIVEPSAGEIEPGQMMRLKYDAAAEGGLFSTRWILSGPCDLQESFEERFKPRISHDVTFMLPRECKLGVPMTITVAGVDAAYRTKGIEVKPSLTIVDKTPPTLQPLYFNPADRSAAEPWLRGGFFAGQTVSIWPNAVDNHAVRSVHWKLLPFGLEDSVIVGSQGITSISIPTQPDWTGKIQIRLWAEDEVGLKSQVVETEQDSLWLWPTLASSARTASVVGEVRSHVVDPTSQVLYLATVAPAKVYALSLASMSVVSSVALPGLPVDMDITASGDSLLVSVDGSAALSVIDVRQTPYTLSSLPISGLDPEHGVTPRGIRVLSNGHALVGVGSLTGASGLHDVDIATGAHRERTDAARGQWPATRVSRSANRRVAVLNDGCLQRYDVSTDTFSSCTSPRVTYFPPVADATASRIAVSIDLYDGSLTFQRRVRSYFATGFTNVAFSADGALLYQLGAYEGIVITRVSDGAVLGRYLNPIAPQFISVAPDGKSLITIDAGWNDPSEVSVIAIP